MASNAEIELLKIRMEMMEGDLIKTEFACEFIDTIIKQLLTAYDTALDMLVSYMGVDLKLSTDVIAQYKSRGRELFNNAYGDVADGAGEVVKKLTDKIDTSDKIKFRKVETPADLGEAIFLLKRAGIIKTQGDMVKKLGYKRANTISDMICGKMTMTDAFKNLFNATFIIQ